MRKFYQYIFTSETATGIADWINGLNNGNNTTVEAYAVLETSIVVVVSVTGFPTEAAKESIS